MAETQKFDVYVLTRDVTLPTGQIVPSGGKISSKQLELLDPTGKLEKRYVGMKGVDGVPVLHLFQTLTAEYDEGALGLVELEPQAEVV